MPVDKIEPTSIHTNTEQVEVAVAKSDGKKKSAPKQPSPQIPSVDPTNVQHSDGGKFSAAANQTVAFANSLAGKAGDAAQNVAEATGDAAGDVFSDVVDGVSGKYEAARKRLRPWSPEELRARPDWVADFKRAADHLDSLSMRDNTSHLQEAQGRQGQLMEQLSAIANEVAGKASMWTRVSNTFAGIAGTSQTPEEKLKVILDSNESLFVSLTDIKSDLEGKTDSFIGEVARWHQNQIDNVKDMEELRDRMKEHQGALDEGQVAIDSGDLSEVRIVELEATMSGLNYELKSMKRELEVRHMQRPRFDSSITLGEHLVGLADEMVTSVTSVLHFSLMEIERLQTEVILTGGILNAKTAAFDMLNAIELANHAINLVAANAAEETVRMRLAMSTLAETLNTRDQEGVNAVKASTAKHEEMNNKAVEAALAGLREGVDTGAFDALQTRLRDVQDKKGVKMAKKSKHRTNLEKSIGA